MGEGSKIQWTHHTFNPWRGCTHVSPGCEHCYAETLSKRNPAQLGTWGAGGTRVVASEAYWKQPERWNEAAWAAGERHRVFCASLADVFEDRPELVEPRGRLIALIVTTPHLDWLLLTKRPENAARLMARHFDDPALGGGGRWPRNVWLGATVEDQRRADERIPILLDTPAAVRFLSCEPLLGPVDLTGAAAGGFCGQDRIARGFLQPNGCHTTPDGQEFGALCECRGAGTPGIDWVIVGGESGPKARPMDLAWARSLVEQGRSSDVPVFVKQLGARPVESYTEAEGGGRFREPWALRHRAGGAPDEWPPDLRVREFPGVQ